jgi:hypothetical protein
VQALSRTLAFECALAISFSAAVAAAADEGEGRSAERSRDAASEARPAEGATAPFSDARRSYVHSFGSLGFGRGVRLNNPYRLQTVLGDTPESLSLSASYVDLGLGAAFGDPDGLRHGAVAHLSIAVQGIAQEVVSLSYLALGPVARDWLLSARAGVPVVLEPDLGVGLELGVGAAFLVSGGIGLSAELISSLFFGAATWESNPTIIPVVSLQAGAWVQYEMLP